MVCGHTAQGPPDQRVASSWASSWTGGPQRTLTASAAPYSITSSPPSVDEFLSSNRHFRSRLGRSRNSIKCYTYTAVPSSMDRPTSLSLEYTNNIRDTFIFFEDAALWRMKTIKISHFGVDIQVCKDGFLWGKLSSVFRGCRLPQFSGLYSASRDTC